MKTRRYDPAEVNRRLNGSCFICEMLAGNPDYRHHIVFQDETTVAFLSKYPQLYGYTLVAPRRHVEQVSADFTEAEYIALQRIVFRVGEALRRAVPTERLYILSLGSQAANRHVHWHIAPLPPGVPLEEQQYAALSRNEILDLNEAEMSALAARLKAELA
jgi:diadenosine tetraphosphate (Ap4A) HIT family hydrolase